MADNRPIGKVRIIGAIPRDPNFSDKLPWYSSVVKFSLCEYSVYLDNSLEFPLVDPTVVGFSSGTYAAIARCDAELVD